jgi:uncharacterized protein YigE (DUF2233 family)
MRGALTKSLGLLAVVLICTPAARAVTCETRMAGALPFIACRVDLKVEHLGLFWRDEAGRPYRQFSALRDALESHGMQLLFAVNGGMYLPDFSPVGLFVADGRELVALNRHTGPGNFSQQPNGVFLIEGNAARLMTTDDYWREKPKPLLATQSGPMLVHEGQITTSEVMNPNSPWRKVRNGVCAPSPDTVVFVISESAVTFYELASFFRDALQCREALYLDGSVSSLYAPSFNRQDHGWDIGPIIGIVGSKSER